MAASGVNVFRYSALVTGILYGFSHQSTLTKQQRTNEINRAYHAKESLISKAKAAYVQKHLPPEQKTVGGGADPNDPKFDFEAYFTMRMADEAK